MSEENNESELNTDGVRAENSDNESKSSETESIEKDLAENEEVLSYPERVPNSQRGVGHKHSYVMLGLIIVFLIFSFIISNFTVSY
tara:strand:- start:551 stop:808 length:258 start_codon:yes stop_codon:yes gene_type:complete